MERDGSLTLNLKTASGFRQTSTAKINADQWRRILEICAEFDAEDRKAIREKLHADLAASVKAGGGDVL